MVLQVVTEAEFAAEMTRRELELRRELEQWRAAQRDLRDAADTLATDKAAVDRARSLGRRQIDLSQRCATTAERFDTLLAEMRANGAATSTDEQRLGAGVAGPLRQLATERMPAVAVLLDAWNASTPAALPAPLADILAQFDTMLARLREREAYWHAVRLLEQMIEQQERLHTDTTAALEAEVDALLEILGDDAGATPREPKR